MEVSVASGTGKLKTAGGLSGEMKESAQRAFAYLNSKKTELGVGRDVDTSDFHVQVIDLIGNRVEAEIGVAVFVAFCSALRQTSVAPALLVLGDMSVQGNIKAARSLAPARTAARRKTTQRSVTRSGVKRNAVAR